MNTAVHPDSARTPSVAPRLGFRFAAMRGTLLLNAVAPLATYEVLTRQGVSELTALAVGALFPLAGVGIGAIRGRRLDPFAAVTLAAIAISLIGAVVFASPRFLLLKESVITATIGLAFLGSLVASRPLTFVIARQMATDPAVRIGLEQRWLVPEVRRSFRLFTMVWGLALVAEAALRTVLSFVVTPGVLMLISPLLAVAVFGSLGAWTWRHRRTVSHAQRTAEIAA